MKENERKEKKEKPGDGGRVLGEQETQRGPLGGGLWGGKGAVV